jgi:hypothetical protein
MLHGKGGQRGAAPAMRDTHYRMAMARIMLCVRMRSWK